MSTPNTFRPRAVAIALHRHAMDGKFSVPQHDGIIHDKAKLNGFSLDQDVAQKIRVNTHFNGKETPLEVGQLIKFLENPDNLSFFAEEVEAISGFGAPEHVIERLDSIGRTLSMLHSLVEIKRHKELLSLNEKKLAAEDHETHAKIIHKKHDLVAETIRDIHQKIQEVIFSHHQKTALEKGLASIEPNEGLSVDEFNSASGAPVFTRDQTSHVPAYSRPQSKFIANALKTRRPAGTMH